MEEGEEMHEARQGEVQTEDQPQPVETSEEMEEEAQEPEVIERGKKDDEEDEE